MAFPNAAGTPSYSGTFIPEVWSGKLVAKYYDASVLAAISNTDYEGEVSAQGDKVKIRTIPSLQINDYQSGQNLTLQRPTSAIIELNIDKGKYWSAVIDDVQALQADMSLMDMWSSDASEQMKIALDTDVLGTIDDSAIAANSGTTAGRISGDINLGSAATAVTLTKGNVIDYIIDHNLVLDEANIPEQGRYIVLPAWACAMLKKSDLKDASLTGDGTSVLRNGRIGMIDRTTVYNSNLLPSAAGKYTVYAGHKSALAFAAQLTKLETIRAESTFGDIMRGLMVYGFKVVDPTAMTVGVVAK
jgi:hypothetical protein